MKILVTRISKGTIKINKKIKATAGKGIVVFAGIQKKDTESTLLQAVRKILSLRIFEDSAGRISRSIQEKKGSLLCVPNFTLCASTKKGTSPCFADAMNPAQAEKVFDKFVRLLENSFENVKPAVFGADMAIELILDGPVNMNLEI